jgi:hypothetical protein
MRAQQMDDPGQSDAVEHPSVAVDAQEEPALHEFVCALRFAQQTWLALQRLRLASGPQLGPWPAPESMTGGTASGPESAGGGDMASDGASVTPTTPSRAASSGGTPSSG